MNQLNPKVIIYFIAGYESHGHGSNWPAKNEIDIYDWYDKLLETEGLSKSYKLLALKAYLLYFQASKSIEPEKLFKLKKHLADIEPGGGAVFRSELEDVRKIINKLEKNLRKAINKQGSQIEMPKTAPLSHDLEEMKNRKMKKQKQKNVKNVKQVIVTEGATDEYNIENILEELGESESKKKPTKKKSNSKTKADRKRCGNVTTIGEKDKSPGDNVEHITADDTTRAAVEDNEELVEISQSDVNSQDHISSTNGTVLPELALQGAMMNLQTSGSTEDMFTPVISKQSKRKNKKAGLSNLSKDDLARHVSDSENLGGRVIRGAKNLRGRAVRAGPKSRGAFAPPASPLSTCLAQTSSSLASSTTSSTMAASSGPNTSSYSSILSAKPANVEMLLNVEKFNESLKIVEEQTSEFKDTNQGLSENLDQNSKDEGKIHNLESEIQNIKESRLCKICFDEEISRIFLPCGHTICCNVCAIGMKKCPICRKDIQKSQIMYFS